MTDISSALDRTHGLPGIARVVDGRGGLPKVQVTTAAAAGEVYLHGAQVTSWSPAGQRDVLFVSQASRWEPGRAIRGGIPICFPWFGNKAGDPQAPAHGFVRSKTWTLESIAQTDAGVVVSIATGSDAETKGRWPFDARLVLRATFGASLQVALVATNTGTAPFTFEEALHTYYAIGDATTVRIAGLDGVRYLDKVDAGRERLQEGDIAIAAETDRVYLNTAGAVDIDDPALRRRIHVSKQNSQSTVVWNPWIDKARALADLQDDDWARLVCVETCNVAASAIALAPGQQHTMTLTVTVSSI
jgi:glucose-6-phosphate 1-epimerase